MNNEPSLFSVRETRRVAVTFGLGHHQSIDCLYVVWPGGQIQEMVPPSVDQLAVLEEDLPTTK